MGFSAADTRAKLIDPAIYARVTPRQLAEVFLDHC